MKAVSLIPGPAILAAASCLLACSASATASAPSDETELPQRLAELRATYAPYLRSLPHPLSERERTALPAEWKFTFEAKDSPKEPGIPPGPAWHTEDFDDGRWESTRVPEWRYRTKEGDGTALEPKKLDSWRGVQAPADTICWYRTRFRGGPSAAGKRRWLCFDGVDWEAQVFLNGELLGAHRVYFEPFR